MIALFKRKDKKEQKQEGNSNSRETPLERKTTEDTLKVTSEASDSSDSTGIDIGHSPVPVSCKSSTLVIAEGEASEKSCSGHLQIRHSKSASVLTSEDIDSSDEEEPRS